MEASQLDPPRGKQRIYRKWQGMKDRCYNTHSARYKTYGQRGVTVCDKWINDFPAFRSWAMTHGYSDGLEIHRKDCDKGYCPTNCVFVTHAQHVKISASSHQRHAYLIQLARRSRGVEHRYLTGRWHARIKMKGKWVNVGSYDSESEATKAYQDAVTVKAAKWGM